MIDFINNFLIPCFPLFGMLLFNNCCCQPSCTFFTDDFNRADDDDPGSYTEVSGDWDISSNKLVTSDSNAVLIADAEHPDGEPNIKVSVSVNIATNGDAARIILDYVDSNNYWFGEVRAGTGAYLRIYQRASGSNTQKAQASITRATGQFDICASISHEGVIILRVGTTDVSAVGSFSSPKFGLGTGTITGTIQFTSILDHPIALKAIGVNNDDEDADCHDCGRCTLCVGHPPPEIRLDITDLVGDCTSLSNALTGSFYLQKRAGCTWCGQLPSPITMTNGVNSVVYHSMFATLSSGSEPGTVTMLILLDETSDCEIAGFLCAPAAGSLDNNCSEWDAAVVVEEATFGSIACCGFSGGTEVKSTIYVTAIN